MEGEPPPADLRGVSLRAAPGARAFTTTAESSMPDIIEMRQKLNKLWEAQKGLIDRADAEKRGFTAEEEAEYQKREIDIADADKAINNAAAAEQRQAQRKTDLEAMGERLKQPATRAIKPPAAAEQRGDDNRPEKRFLDRFNSASLSPDVLKGFQLRASSEYERAYRTWLTAVDGRKIGDAEQRALSVGTASAGGYAVPVQEFINQLIMALDDAAPLLAKATVFDLPQAMSLGVPTLEANPADADWTAELLTGSEDSTMAFGKRELQPYPLAKLLKVSKKLLRASPLGMDKIIADRLAYKVGIAVEKGLLTGTGANQPLGIFTGSSSGIPTSQDTNLLTSSAIDPDKLITMRHSIRDAYKNLTWVLHRTTLAAIRKLKGSATGNYMWQPGMGMTGPVPSTLLDFPYILDENAPQYATSGGTYLCLLGDLSYIWVARALNFDIQRLDELYALTNQMGYIVRTEIDGMPVLGDAFVRGVAT
jgi:HK97 family phage major capsid protein